MATPVTTSQPVIYSDCSMEAYPRAAGRIDLSYALSATKPDLRSELSTLAHRVLPDLGGVVLIAIISLRAGLVMNRFASSLLPTVYQTPERRPDLELTSRLRRRRLRSRRPQPSDFRSFVRRAKKNALILGAS